jgi:hypothetical protein
VTWYEISYITTTYTNTSTIVETNTTYKIVLKPTLILQVEVREVTDERGRVSIIQEHVTRAVMVPVTVTHEELTTRTSEIVEDTIITSSKVFTETRYSTIVLVETIKPEIIESEENYQVFLLIAVAVGLVAAIALVRSRRK